LELNGRPRDNVAFETASEALNEVLRVTGVAADVVELGDAGPDNRRKADPSASGAGLIQCGRAEWVARIGTHRGLRLMG